VDRAATTRESRVDRRESREDDVAVGNVGTLSTRGRETGESGGGVVETEQGYREVGIACVSDLQS